MTSDPESDHNDNRRALRSPVQFRARLRDRSSTRFDVYVLDLSRTGFRAEASYSLHPGDIVWLNLPGMEGLEAKVAWREGRIIGAAFDHPLHEAVFAHIVAHSDREGAGKPAT